MKITILIPVYNDWQSLFKLLEKISYEIKNLDHKFSIIIINDGSTENIPEVKIGLDNFDFVKLLNIKSNMGHARGIALGLKFILKKQDFDYIIPMDGDGEDRPEEIKDLIEKSQNDFKSVVTANRVKRSEGIFFKICYELHKLMTLVFTGQNVKFGNFTLLPKSTVEKMVAEKATWNSFSGALCRITKDRKSIPSIRGERYFGPSKMSFFNLIEHSLSIISVFKYTWLVRSIIFLVVYIYLISSYISAITLIPLVVMIVLNTMIFKLSLRENINEYQDSLSKISNINILK
ncbi:MAG: glycosyl transferase [Candidatus Pelagibacter sp. TMED166]|nr:MAG: glycosyl transferase [Candidatus Pelagibacter sp. TMED166]|tara:strand:+ start:1101 stop:1970 length:870 start_codon:yes stop_codon:yes gene_type:complete